MSLLYILIALLIGIGIPLQTTINSRLNGYVKLPLVASFIVFTIGSIFLVSISFLMGYNIWIPLDIFSDHPWWIWLGGALGVIGLTANILLFPRIGSIQTVIIPMLGQIVMGVLIDHWNWFNSKHVPFTLWRALGVLCVVVGIFMVIMLADQSKSKGQEQKAANTKPANKWIWQFLGIVAGMMIAMRSAINGQLGVVLNSPVQSGLISLISGSILLLLIILLLRLNLKSIVFTIKTKSPWWIWTGGVLGALFIVATVFLVPLLGIGTVIIIGILGQLSCSLAIDKYGLLGSQKRPVSIIQVIGLIILLGGVVIMRIF